MYNVIYLSVLLFRLINMGFVTIFITYITLATHLHSKAKIIVVGGKHPPPLSLLDKNSPIGIGLKGYTCMKAYTLWIIVYNHSNPCMFHLLKS